MQGYNLIVIFHPNDEKVLMCKRLKSPYLGLSNFVGGKIEPSEDSIDAAYRELFEETSITRDDVFLTHLMTFTYPLDPCYVEVYVGKLKCEITVSGDENELYWSTLDHNFFDMTKYAGEGNIGHIFEMIKIFQQDLKL